MDNSELILLTDSFYPFKDSTSNLNTSIAEFLSINNKISVVCAKSLFSKNTYEKNKKFSVIRLSVPFVNSKIVLFKILKFLSFSLLIFLFVIFKNSKNCIYLVSTSPPVLIPIVSFLIDLKKFLNGKKTKNVLLAQDIYPDIIENSYKKSNLSKLFFYFLNKIYLSSYGKFDFVFCCCDAIKDKLVNKYELDHHKIEVINNWSLINQNLLNKLTYPKLEKNNKVKIFLIGNLGKLHLCDQTEKALRNLLVKSYLIDELHMYTSGLYHLKIFKKMKNLENVFLHEIIKPDCLVNVYSKPSITVVPLSRIATQCAFPSRIATALSLGSPILLITDYLSNNYLVDFIKKYKIGIVLSKENIHNNNDFISKEFGENFNYFQDNCVKLYEDKFLKVENLRKIESNIEKLKL